jgi:hypothetical protein
MSFSNSFGEETKSEIEHLQKMISALTKNLRILKVEEKQGLRESALRWARKALEINERLGVERYIEESRQLVERLEQALAEEGEGKAAQGTEGPE